MFRISVTDQNRENTREVIVEGNELHIGRGEGNDVVLPTAKVSKRHARMVIDSGVVLVADLNSTNGTLVREQKITRPTTVSVGETFVVGDFFVRLDAAEATEANRPSGGLVIERLPTSNRTAPGRAAAPSSAPPVLSFIPGVTDNSPAAPSAPAAPASTPRTPAGATRGAPPPVPANATAGHPRVSTPSGTVPAVPATPAPPQQTRPSGRPVPSHERAAAVAPAVVTSQRGFTPANAMPPEETAQLFLVGRDDCWDEPDFITHWERGLTALVDNVSVEALPATIVSENPRMVTTYSDLATRITDAFVDDGELSADKAASLQRLLVAAAVGIGPLDALTMDPDVSEIHLALEGAVRVTRSDGSTSNCPLRITEPGLASRFAQRIHARIGHGLYRGFDVQAAKVPMGDGRWWLRLTRMPSVDGGIDEQAHGDVLQSLRDELASGATVVCCVDPAPMTSTAIRQLLATLGITDAVVVGRPEVGEAVKCAAAGPGQLKEMQFSPALLVVPALEPGAVSAWLWHRLVYRTPTLLVVGAESEREALARLAISAALEFPGAVEILTRLTCNVVSVKCGANQLDLHWCSNSPS